jgi:hypothetical protein
MESKQYIILMTITWIMIMLLLSGNLVSCSDDDNDGDRKTEIKREPNNDRIYPESPIDTQDVDGQGNPIDTP